MEFSDLNTTGNNETVQGSNENVVYENTEVKSVTRTKSQKGEETGKDEGHYEQLRFDSKPGNKATLCNPQEDALRRQKYVIYIMGTLVIVLYIAIIALIIVLFVPKAPVDGKWTQWSDWTSCDVTCGTGTQIRTRSCTDPVPAHGGTHCVGEGTQNNVCTEHTCPVTDGGWTGWGNWSTCTVTCGGGIQSRTRTCTNPKPSDRGEYCIGNPLEIQPCSPNRCSLTDVGWTDWGNWATCTATCGGGVQSRSRRCTDPNPSDSGEYCIGDPLEIQPCSPNRCFLTDGGWTDWGNWSTCTVTCGGGVQSRSRACANPNPSDRGEYCIGPPLQIQPCSLNRCSPMTSAFSVDKPSRYRSSKLTFSHTIYELGNDFNLSTGTYTCSMPGTYHFSATLVKKRASSRVDRVYCSFYKNLFKLIEIYIDPTDDDTDIGSAAISQSVVIHLDKGDTVYLGSCIGQPSTYMESWSSFTGFLLYPDN